MLLTSWVRISVLHTTPSVEQLPYLFWPYKDPSKDTIKKDPKVVTPRYSNPSAVDSYPVD